MPDSHCPKCHSRKIRRTHRRGLFEWALKQIGILPYRCTECRARFYRYARQSQYFVQ